mgnify:CR=1 FL=1
MNVQIQKLMEEHEFLECDVICTLGAVAAFGDADSSFVAIGRESEKIIDVFCYYDADEAKYKIKRPFLPVDDESLWSKLLLILRDKYGFTENGLPPFVSTFNIYKKLKNTEERLMYLTIEGYSIEDIAASIARFFETTKYPTTIAALIEDGLKERLIMGSGNTKIEGLI